MYTGYQIYQAERPKSAREQQEIDRGNAKLVEAVARMWGLLARPVPRHQTRRAPVPGRPAPCAETSR
jgi:hypothetical protein